MTRTYYTVIVFLDKDKQDPEITVETADDTDLPPIQVTIGPRYIVIRTFHRTHANAEKAAADARRRWQAGALDDVLNAVRNCQTIR
jgi:hypothetical protein